MATTNRALRGACALCLGMLLLLDTGCRKDGGGGNGDGGPGTQVNLTYSPFGGRGAPQVNPGKATIFVERVVDKRSDKETIGLDPRGKSPTPAYATSDPTEFLHGALNKELADLGYPMADSAAAADVVLSPELTRFFVNEGNTYQAEVRFNCGIRTKSGQTFMESGLRGESSDWGKNHNPLAYNKTLSNATRDAVYNLLVKNNFQAAVRRGSDQ